jgi:hypothetical protein
LLQSEWSREAGDSLGVPWRAPAFNNTTTYCTELKSSGPEGREFPLPCPRLILPSPLSPHTAPPPSSDFPSPPHVNCRCAIVLISPLLCFVRMRATDKLQFHADPRCIFTWKRTKVTRTLFFTRSLSLARARALSHSHSLFRVTQSMQGTNRRFLFRLLSVLPLATMQFPLGNGQKTSHTDFFLLSTTESDLQIGFRVHARNSVSLWTSNLSGDFLFHFHPYCGWHRSCNGFDLQLPRRPERS